MVAAGVGQSKEKEGDKASGKRQLIQFWQHLLDKAIVFFLFFFENFLVETFTLAKCLSSSLQQQVLY